MSSCLYGIIFDRGPMPFVSIAGSVAAVVLVLALRPATKKAFLLTTAVCFIPLLAGIAGYFMGIRLADQDWQAFLATNPSQEVIESAKEALAIGKLCARDPFYLGIALFVPPMVLNVLVFGITRLTRKGPRP